MEYYSPSPDYRHEGCRPGSPCGQPLQESTANIQHPQIAWYAQHLEALPSIPSSIPPVIAPILPTQSLGPDKGAPAYPRSQQRHGLHPHGRRQRHEQGSNPLMPLLTQAFQNYRKKQADKPEQKWPEVLEGHFLDALLLIPQMGRSKYSIEQRQQGRNQLIGKYLWVASCRDLRPGEKPSALLLEIRGEKGRKRVSSHIQVVRSFFATHRCLHFLFGSRQKDKDDKDERHVQKVPLKHNPVLIALSENRMPEQRPNYEYFAQILALNDQVQFRPRRCWIFVSQPDVVVTEDGSGYLPTTGTKLRGAEYPHLRRNLQRDTWVKEEQLLFKGALLHEFTKEIQQVESGSVSDLSRKWESAFPSLHQRLKAITSSTTDATCDVLHLHTTLELKEKPSFPAESSLSSWVEFSIEQPHLLNHRWKVETRLVRPSELSSVDDSSRKRSGQTKVCERHKDFTIKYQHQPGCDSSRSTTSGRCDCLSRRSRRDGVSVPFPVPFPATAWAQTLTKCAEYPAHPYNGMKRHERGPAVKCEKQDTEKTKSRRRSKEHTQMNLIPKIAMMQEIFSCPPTLSREEGGNEISEGRWTRRGVILWTFDTIHSIVKEGKDTEKLQTASGGRTSWRFLTILDPASDHHLQQATVSGHRASADEPRGVSNGITCASQPVSRTAILSPSPTYQQHLDINLNENFPSTWDNVGGPGSLSSSTLQTYDAQFMSQSMSSHAAASQAGYDLHDSFSSHSGLETPPLTASSANSFVQSFDTASAGSDLLPTYMAAQDTVATTDMNASSHPLDDALPAVSDPFLSHIGTAYSGVQHGISSWDIHVHNGPINWPGQQPHSAQSRRSSEQHHGQPQTTHPHPTGRHTWAPSTLPTGMDDSDPWMMVLTSANAPNAGTVATRAADRSRDYSAADLATATSASDLSQDWEEIHHTLPVETEHYPRHTQHWAPFPAPSSIENVMGAVGKGEVEEREEQKNLDLHRAESTVAVSGGNDGGSAASLDMSSVSRKRGRELDDSGDKEREFCRPRARI
ncbi:regulatory protein abaA [Corynascus novoguineensis]|uniref:Regulatory protein abaA n=1 Tax=Corynascus novoguineensis TaxID=1126955 RepID=A0AAN7HPG1_9PEZI|nr:regulatory protein abaA [Corynascus novoguineensis]